MSLPKIPKKNTQQWKLMKALVDAANDSFGKHAWFLSLEGLTHDQFIKNISNLREKGWPIEDQGIGKENEIDDLHGYRMDKERWSSIKDEINSLL